MPNPADAAALGIGANTAIFSALFPPMPVSAAATCEWQCHRCSDTG
jgi:hypothetical protein